MVPKKLIEKNLIREAIKNEELIIESELDFKWDLDEVDRERLAIRRFLIVILGLENAHELRQFLQMIPIKLTPQSNNSGMQNE